jgi:hypothetical protein
MSMASVYSMRSKGRSIICVQPRQHRVVDALVEERHIVLTLVEHACEHACLSRSSARSALSARSAKATSGSIIQNSARWRLVLLFSARKVGPKVYTLLIARQ